jgi:gas vesicle protein GvpN
MASQKPQVATAPPSDFVETPFLKELVDRSLAYIKDGLHVHFCGPAGGGKTTLALHVARLLGRPVVLVNGDDEMGTADLVGKESGYNRSYTRDEYVHTVLKVEEEMKPMWVGRALTEACQNGSTVVYDEFTRSRPEANNVLLSVLEERVLPLRGKSITVHPDFRIVFTSNPAEYAGVHGAQDALLDRMVTILVKGFDQATETAITQERSGLPLVEVERIIALVRAFRDAGLKTSSASVRPAILISRILRVRSGHAHAEDTVFLQTCRDVLLSQARRMGSSAEEDKQNEQTLLRLIQEICSEPLPSECRAPKAAIHEVEPDNLMAELGEDKEVQELLLRKLRQKGLSSKLLAELLKGDPSQ